MNNPENAPADIEEMRAWMVGHKAQLGLGWEPLGKRVGIAGGTLGPWCQAKYQGDNQRVANDVYRYRQLLTSQAQIEVDAPTIPGFVKTPTAQKVLSLLGWAHRGKIVAAAMGPGTGKTMTIQHYRDSVTHCFVATMAPSTAGVNNMLMEVMAALGEPDAKGTPQSLSRRVKDKVRSMKALLVIDEAQHLSEKSVEELRSLHDATGLGLGLFGNHEVIGRLEGGSRKAAYAQLYSRVSMRHEQLLPTEIDARVLADAWEIADDAQLKFLISVALRPGGLRGMSMVLELATMIAAAEQRRVSVGDMQDAWLQLSSRPRSA
ncbi:AAA family ATPase [Blastomonas fulva]|uniref:AAA family ATPase n=1 Tax=Blastomonas fulva TaxID=1550728 RepID=UPI0025A37979|nr:AAA family ATPase [Blastomonas fulva]MDM7928688.1 AAA family ATPase [Blastomonas fulva]MDM7964474.1 AAA family ATPase [Blastomonas fulva]